MAAGSIVLTTLTDEHYLPFRELCQRLNTNLTEGLRQKDASRLLKLHGKNKFSPPADKTPSKFKQALRSVARQSVFTNLGYTASRWNSVDSVISTNSTMSGESDENRLRQPRKPTSGRPGSYGGDSCFSKAEWKKLFGSFLPETVVVIRDGKRKTIPGKLLVQGDLVELRTGCVVPADMRLVFADDLCVDNRLITGHRRQHRGHSQAEIPQSCDILTADNMLYACTRVIDGFGVGLVLRTGERTVFGTLKNFALKVEYTTRRNMAAPQLIAC